jgi:asparagine synthetase A
MLLMEFNYARNSCHNLNGNDGAEKMKWNKIPHTAYEMIQTKEILKKWKRQCVLIVKDGKILNYG